MKEGRLFRRRFLFFFRDDDLFFHLQGKGCAPIHIVYMFAFLTPDCAILKPGNFEKTAIKYDT